MSPRRVKRVILVALLIACAVPMMAGPPNYDNEPAAPLVVSTQACSADVILHVVQNRKVTGAYGPRLRSSEVTTTTEAELNREAEAVVDVLKYARPTAGLGFNRDLANTGMSYDLRDFSGTTLSRKVTFVNEAELIRNASQPSTR